MANPNLNKQTVCKLFQNSIWIFEDSIDPDQMASWYGFLSDVGSLERLDKNVTIAIKSNASNCIYHS